MKGVKERKINKGAIKRVILKTVGMTLLIDIPVILIMNIVFWANESPEEIKLVYLIIAVMNVLPIYFYGSTFISQEKDKVKSTVVEDIFRKDANTAVYPKVFPKKGHFKQRKFFQEELPRIADYYANLYENGTIEIVARLKDGTLILHIEDISKENFIDSYDVLEATLTNKLN